MRLQEKMSDDLTRLTQSSISEAAQTEEAVRRAFDDLDIAMNKAFLLLCEPAGESQEALVENIDSTI